MEAISSDGFFLFVLLSFYDVGTFKNTVGHLAGRNNEVNNKKRLLSVEYVQKMCTS